MATPFTDFFATWDLSKVETTLEPDGTIMHTGKATKAKKIIPDNPEDTGRRNQWASIDDRTFQPAGNTYKQLQPGNYWLVDLQNGYALQRREVETDEIVPLPDTVSAEVVHSIETFWKSKHLYDKHGLVFKRGILLYGPQGSGKSITLRVVGADIIRQGGVVLHAAWPSEAEVMVQMVRQVEKDLPIVVIIEDIDRVVGSNQEQNLLSLLDGENQISNVVYMTTTNYPEQLPPRLINRPSRIDEGVLVDMPSLQARKVYLEQATKGQCDADMWAEKTKGFSIAHLRELVASVHCLNQDFDQTLNRLTKMMEGVTGIDGFRKKKKAKTVGFDVKQTIFSVGPED